MMEEEDDLRTDKNQSNNNTNNKEDTESSGIPNGQKTEECLAPIFNYKQNEFY